MIQEVREDAARCRELIGPAAGAGSLLAKVVPDTLDDEQTAKYQAVKDGRRDCRWQAAVATVLDRLDETLGFTQRQHDTLTAALLAASPAADELEGGSPLQPEPTVGLAATRLAAAVSGDTSLAALLDPWQRAALARPGSRARIWLKGSPSPAKNTATIRRKPLLIRAVGLAISMDMKKPSLAFSEPRRASSYRQGQGLNARSTLGCRILKNPLRKPKANLRAHLRTTVPFVADTFFPQGSRSVQSRLGGRSAPGRRRGEWLE